MFTTVKKCILEKVQIPDEDLERSFAYCQVHNYKKGQLILRAGEYCRFIGFLNSGLIISTIDNDGKEMAANFILEQCFFTYTEGLTQQIPSHKNFVALEDIAGYLGIEPESLSRLRKRLAGK